VQSFYHPRMMIFFLLLGIALRVWAYVRDTSLYLDEILLSRNILDLPLRHLLTKPLMLDQVAPRGFLLVEHLAVVIFGPSEMALRLLPFVCSITSVVLFRRLAERILTADGAAIALFLFAIGVPFIRFGTEVKQYECDLVAAIVLLLLTLNLVEHEASTKRLVISGIAVFVVIWFSQVSVLVMAGLGMGLALQWVASRDRRIGRALLITIPLWTGASLVAVVAGFRSMTQSTRQFMNEFWAGAFIPLPLRSERCKLDGIAIHRAIFRSDATSIPMALGLRFLSCRWNRCHLETKPSGSMAFVWTAVGGPGSRNCASIPVAWTTGVLDAPHSHDCSGGWFGVDWQPGERATPIRGRVSVGKCFGSACDGAGPSTTTV
jgi:hypothetical protein